MNPEELIAKLARLKSKFNNSEEDITVLEQAISYIKMVEERHKISRPNPLFPICG